jgi:enoyl-CoA hydratase/carnithine racemase
MHPSEVMTKNNVSVLKMTHGKVNALNEDMVIHITGCFNQLRDDEKTKVVILTGHRNFFSFGLDVPELYNYDKDRFMKYLDKFTNLYADIFTFPKPIIAAINGHAIAGGCMLATACDYRIMVTGKAKISLNEVTFGSSVFWGSTEILKCCVGHAKAEEILLGGQMYSAEQAYDLGLVNEISTTENLTASANDMANKYIANDLRAYAALKKLLRDPVANRIIDHEPQGNRDFTELWYSAQTREKLQDIKIR